MRREHRRAKLALAILGATLGMLAVPASSMARDTVFGLTATDKIVTFSSAKPGLVSAPVTPAPLAAGDDIEAIDFRPATSRLYALIRNGTSMRVAQLVRNPTTGAITVANIGPSSGATGITGDHVLGFDFNPVADRARVHSDDNDNFRFNPNPPGALAAADPDLMFSDGPGDPSVVASAYSRSFPAPGSTQLYGIDSGEDRVVTMQSPSPTFQNVTRRGTLGIDVLGDAGFDISPKGDALAAIATSVGGATRLYRIDVDQPAGSTSPAAKDLGVITPASAADKVEDIAIAPPVRSIAAILPGTPQQFTGFRADLPEGLQAPRPITGLPGGVSLVGMDTRQKDGELYGLGSDSMLYRLSYDTSPTEVPAIAVAGAFPTPLDGTAFGVDFNPVADRLRIVSNAEQNLRIVPTSPATPAAGTTAGEDTDLNPGDPNIVGAGYTNAFEAAQNTTLFGIDSTPAAPGGLLVRQGDVDGTPTSPNSGTLAPVGSLGTFTDPSETTGYDIVPETNLGYMATDNAGGTAESVLYSIGGGNFPSEAVPVGQIGGAGSGVVVEHIAFLNDDVVGLGSVSVAVPEDQPVAPIQVVRSGPADNTVTVQVGTQSLTATAPFDFGPPQPSTTVTFAPGETIKTVTVPIIDDALVEGTEAFRVEISQPTGGAAIGNFEITTVVIADNEVAPGAAPEQNSGQGQVINGTFGNDNLVGTPGDDVITCGFGDDVVNGGGGNDVIDCGPGNDRVTGGAGDDAISGGAGNDVISGDSGDDVIVAGNGNDRATGGSGSDAVGGEGGNDTAAGNGGADSVSGSTGDDTLTGAEGDDRLSGGAGNDRASGGNGNDRVAGDQGSDRLSAGSGDDRLTGGSGSDRLGAGSGNDRLFGGSGNDRLRGNSGADRLRGQSGNDRLVGGSGFDRLSGGSGRNVLVQ